MIPVSMAMGCKGPIGSTGEGWWINEGWGFNGAEYVSTSEGWGLNGAKFVTSGEDWGLNGAE